MLLAQLLRHLRMADEGAHLGVQRDGAGIEIEGAYERAGPVDHRR